MKRFVVFGVLVAATALVLTSIAAGHHDVPGTVTPTFFPGKFSNDCENGKKIDGGGGDVQSGDYALFFPNLGANGATVNLSITVVQTAGGPTFTFVSTSGELITSIYVKGGPDGSNLYDYGAGVEHDDGLHSPLNTKNKNGQWYGLSHLCIFADKI